MRQKTLFNIYLGTLLLFAGPAFADGTLELRISLFPTGSFIAKSNDVKGKAERTSDGVKAQNIEVSSSSFSTGIDLRDKHMRERFQSEKFPKILLLEASGKDGKGQGQLKIKNIVKTVTGTYSISGDTLVAVFKTKASEFEINDINYLGVGMEDELEVEARIPISSGSPTAAPKVAEVAKPAVPTKVDKTPTSTKAIKKKGKSKK